MFSIFSATDNKKNDYAEGFGELLDNIQDNTHLDLNYLIGIGASQTQTVMFKPLSGCLNERKYLPIRFMPLAIKLSLVDGMLHPLGPEPWRI